MRRIESLLVLLVLLVVNGVSIATYTVLASAYDGSAGIIQMEELQVPDGAYIAKVIPNTTIVYLGTTYGYGELYKSENSGKTWKLVYDFGDDRITDIYVSRNGTLFLGTNGGVYRSEDEGKTWTRVLDFSNTTYGALSQGNFAEASDGTIYIGEYGQKPYVKPLIYKSTDDGRTWTLVYNLTEIESGANHTHGIAVDIYGNLYAAYGDVDEGLIVFHPNGTWEQWFDKVQPWQILTVDNYVFIGSDQGSYPFVWRYNLTTGELKTVLAVEASDKAIPASASYVNAMIYGGLVPNMFYDSINGVVYVATQSLVNDDVYTYGIYASPDFGETWVKIYEGTTSTSDVQVHEISGVTSDGYIFASVYDTGTGSTKILKIRALSQDELKHLASELSKNVYGGEANSFTRIFDNDTYFSFLAEPLTNAKLRVTGVNVTNLAPNPSFESWDDVTGRPVDWNFYNAGGNATISQSTDAYEGAFSVEIVYFNESPGFPNLYTSSLAVEPDTNYTLSVYWKCNVTNGDLKIALTWYDSDGTKISNTYKELYVYKNDTWSRGLTSIRSPSNAATVVISISPLVLGKYTIDAVQLQKGLVATPFINTTSEQRSENVIITIDGKEFNCGSLNDGESVEFELGNLSGTKELTASIGGSKVVNITVFGEKIFSANNCLLDFSGGKYVFKRIFDSPEIRVYKPVQIELNYSVLYRILGTTATIGNMQVKPTTICNVTVSEYSSDRVRFTADAPSGETVTFTLRDLEPSRAYLILKDGEYFDILLANVSGVISFTNSEWSSSTFEIFLMDYLWWNGTNLLSANFSSTSLYSYGEGDYYAIEAVEDLATKKKFYEVSNNASLQVKVVVCGLEPSASYDVKGYWTNGSLIFSKVVNSNSSGCICYYTTNFADERYTVIEKRTQANWFIVVTAIGGALVAGGLIIKRFRRWIRRGG